MFICQLKILNLTSIKSYYSQCSCINPETHDFSWNVQYLFDHCVLILVIEGWRWDVHLLCRVTSGAWVPTKCDQVSWVPWEWATMFTNSNWLQKDCFPQVDMILILDSVIRYMLWVWSWLLFWIDYDSLLSHFLWCGQVSPAKIGSFLCLRLKCFFLNPRFCWSSILDMMA